MWCCHSNVLLLYEVSFSNPTLPPPAKKHEALSSFPLFQQVIKIQPKLQRTTALSREPQPQCKLGTLIFNFVIFKPKVSISAGKFCYVLLSCFLRRIFTMCSSSCACMDILTQPTENSQRNHCKTKRKSDAQNLSNASSMILGLRQKLASICGPKHISYKL